MHLAKKLSQTELLAYVPSIKSNMGEWQIINVRISAKSDTDVDEVAQKLLDMYEMHEGFMFPASKSKIIMVVRLGIINNFAHLKRDLQNQMPKKSCRVMTRQMSTAGLKQVQIDLVDVVKEDNADEETLFDEREARKTNHIMIVDDDVFMRRVLKQVCAPVAEVAEFNDGDGLVEHYMQHNPDILLLDIHMPNHNGLDLIDRIIETDLDAFIVVLSADSIRKNVMTALEKGAVGFLAKPPDKDKLTEYMDACLTFR